MAIGIDETKYERIDKGHFNSNARKRDRHYESKCYAIWNNQQLNKWDDVNLIDATESNAPIFETNDTFIMSLDLQNRKLSFQTNDDEEYIAFTEIAVGDDIEYCMAVHACHDDDCIQL